VIDFRRVLWHDRIVVPTKIVGTIHSFTKNLGTIIVMLMLAGCTTTPTVESEKPLGSTVTKVDGTARFSTDGLNWKPLRRGKIVEEGMTIQTAEKSTVDFFLGIRIDLRPEHPGKPPIRVPENRDPVGEVIRIYPDSILKLEEVKGHRRTFNWFKYPELTRVQLNLTAGQIMAHAKKSETCISDIKLSNFSVRIIHGLYVINSEGKIWVLVGKAMVTMEGIKEIKEVLPGYLLDTKTGNLSAIPPAVMSAF
jgi:hypothetical protein